ncbi:MAG TPA: ABC transporter permease [Pyrinomonadaceae bacterium]|nr:ABC transporter permease [Pyrinomonadaceae bacterium]
MSKIVATNFLRDHRRELSALLAYFVLLVLVALLAPTFYRAANVRDVVLSNVPVLLVAVGMTLVILVGQIDISVGSQFAIGSVAAGLLAKTGMPIPLVALFVAMLGVTLGSINGALVARLNIPSIVVTLATMVALRDGLRWATEGSWVQNLPANFQWFGLGQTTGQLLIVVIALLIFAAFAWSLKNLAAGREVYATGSDNEAARLSGIHPQRVVFVVFALLGVLTGVAALLNSVRFIEVQGNAGVGLELKAIAAVVVGGAAVSGGRGTLLGTLVGVALLGTIGTALTFLGINSFWEKAIQGAIILAAVVGDVIARRTETHAHARFTTR